MLHRYIFSYLLIKIIGGVGGKPERRLGELPTMPRRCVQQNIPTMPNKNVRQLNPRHTGAVMAFPPRSQRYNQ